MDELASQQPKVYTRNVLKAIALLQNGQSVYVSKDDIVMQVAEQMRRKADMDTVRDHVLKSLGNLIELGILTRNPYANYNFYDFPSCSNLNLRSSIKKRNCYTGGRKARQSYRARKSAPPKPKRQAKSKFKRASGIPVVCNCCRSCIMPFVKTINAIKNATLSTEKMEIDGLPQMSNLVPEEHKTESSTSTRRYEFQFPTAIALTNSSSSIEQSKYI